MLIGAGLVVGVGWLLITLHAPLQRMAATVDDDAYYYFGVAKHLATGHGSTFDGINSTNGYHPLWLLLLTPIWRVASGRSAVVLERVLAGGLFVVALYLVSRIGAALRRPAAMVIGASVLILMDAAGPAHMFTGMESTVLIPCVLAILLVFVRTGGLQRDRMSVPTCWALGCLLAITLLARLDTVFLAGAVVAFALWQLRRVGSPGLVRSAVGLAVPPSITLIGYVVLNELWFGTATPVSGQAKGLGAHGLNWTPLKSFLKSPVLLGHSFWLGLVVLVIVPVSVWVTRRGSSAAARGLAWGAGVVLVAQLLAIGYYMVKYSFPLNPWYFALTEVMLAASVAALLDSSAVTSRVSRDMMVRAACAILGVIILGVAANLYRVDRKGGRAAIWMQSGLALAQQLNKTLPPDAVVAMGNRAGVVSYYLHRPLVQTEGLVNSTAYLDALRHNDIGRFLNHDHVTIYIRSEFDQGVPASTTGCTQFPEPYVTTGTKGSIVVCAQDLLVNRRLPDGSYERVWRYRAELNP